MIILTILAIILVLPFIIPRLLINLFGCYLSRRYSIGLKVAECGFLRFRMIVIELPTQEGPLKLVIGTLTLASTVCLNDVSITSAEKINIGNIRFPLNKIKLPRLFKEDINVLIEDIVVVSGCYSYKIEKISIEKSTSLSVTLDRIIFSDLSIPEVQLFSEMPEELTKQRILFIEQLEVIYLLNHNKNLHLKVNGDLFLQWNLEFHMNIVNLISNLKRRFTALSRLRGEKPPVIDKKDDLPSSQMFSLKFDLNGRLSFGALINDNNQTACIATHSLKITANFPGIKTIESQLICLHFDDHTILACSLAKVTYHPATDAEDLLDRKQNSCGIRLNDLLNSVLNVEIEMVNLLFPYRFDFSGAFNERLMGIIKWLKKFHANPDKPKVKKPIDFDINLRIGKFVMEIEDDSFETKLRNNYMLLEDEYNEQQKRDQTLQDKINELRRTNLMLASSIVEELNRALAKKNSDIYIQRSKQLYSSEARQVPLFNVVIEDADMKILADSSFHEHSDIKNLIKSMDPEGQMDDELSFTTLWCRIVSTTIKTAEINLRDFPLAMLQVKDFTAKGMLLGAEQVAVARARRTSRVYVGRNSEPTTVERSMTPLKIFHNIQLRCTTANYTHGPCWDPVLQQVSIAFEDIVSASSDPSPTLPWWDKMRFLFHGHIKLNCNQLSVVLHASNNPYNQTELIELTLSRALVELSTGKIHVKGDFDALLHTASKYDECRFIHLPNLDVVATLGWNCLGNPNDHFSIMPCAPDKVPDYSIHHSHDSYRSFRSQTLNLKLDIETQFTSPTSSLNPENIPIMVLYGSTIRWLENQKFIFVGPSKLTRRGKLFDNTKPRKPNLSRVFKEIEVNVSLHGFQILYWSSVSKKHGLQIISGQLTHHSEHPLKLIPNSMDNLKRRPQADWQTAFMKSSIANVEVWLFNFNHKLDDFDRQYFMSSNRISYDKEAPCQPQSEEEQYEGQEDQLMDDGTTSPVPDHKLIIQDLKAAWTKDNRDVVTSIFDAFMNSQQLKRNLSTDALKPIRIDQTLSSHAPPPTTATPATSAHPYRHQRQPSTTSLIVLNQSTNPISSVSKNRAVSMLQKLIADSENNPNVYTEESHLGVASETHLYGVEACQMDDVVEINCLIELINSQVVLCGTETPGYVIVSAANTEIRQATHLPVWKNRTLLSKNTWTGSLKGMQYYATVDCQSTDSNMRKIFTSESDIQWLDPDNIDTRSAIYDFPDLVGSGSSVGGVVSSVVGKLSRSEGDQSPSPIQLQRIISKCNCLFYYASHRVGVADNLQHLIPPLPEDDIFIEPWDKEVGVDSFTLTHQDLEISTNSQQYAMIMDIINNLLLFVEPHKKTAFEKLERMRFNFQLSADEVQREPISQLQDQVRKYVAYLKRLERERYLVYRASIDDPMTPEFAEHRLSLDTLSNEILRTKEQLNQASEELSMMISCYKEMQLGAHKAQKQQAASQQGTGAFFANVIKRSEICFQSARWRVTDADGQLGLADIALRNFLYSKVVKSDDSVEHTIELGNLNVSNLIPNQAYKDVLHPTELQANIPLDRQRALRLYCRELAPVAGIPVKEHLEVNIIPITIEMTLQFFQKMVKFFFPERDRGFENSEEHQVTRFGSKKGKKDKNVDKTAVDHQSLTGSMDGSSVCMRRDEDIEKMRERAAKNHTFVHVKVPGIPIKVSYKGKKQKNVTDLKNICLTLPTLEYHNSTWTWLDLLMAVKNDSKHTVIKQALKQKMKISPSVLWSSKSDPPVPAIDSPISDEDKARMLMGNFFFKRKPERESDRWSCNSSVATNTEPNKDEDR